MADKTFVIFALAAQATMWYENVKCENTGNGDKQCSSVISTLR